MMIGLSKKIIFWFLLCVNAFGASDNEKSFFITQQGMVLNLSKTSRLQEWDLIPRVDIVFFYQEPDGSLRPCTLHGIEIKPTRPLIKIKQGEQQGFYSFPEDHVIGVRLVVVPSDFEDGGICFLVAGKEYAIWNKEYGGYSVFKVPDVKKRRTKIQLTYIVNKGKKPVKSDLPKPIKIQGIITEKFPKSDVAYIARYRSLNMNVERIFKIQNNQFRIVINKDELGGDLLISEHDQLGKTWLYKASITNQTKIILPQDADRIITKTNQVSCIIRVDAPSRKIGSKVFEICVYASEESKIALRKVKRYVRFFNKTISFNFHKGVPFELSSGKYWVRLYSKKTHDLVGEREITVKKNPNENIFNVKIRKKSR